MRLEISLYPYFKNPKQFVARGVNFVVGPWEILPVVADYFFYIIKYFFIKVILIFFIEIFFLKV
jgi:hypothetical protein